MILAWSDRAKRSLHTLQRPVQQQVRRAVSRLATTPPGIIYGDVKRFPQAGPDMFAFRVSREYRGLMERAPGGYVLMEFVRRNDRRYYSTE